jgi:carbamoyltransferase
MTKILGVSPAHDSSACLYEDGKIIYFSKEERLSGKKRDKLPIMAILAAPDTEDGVDVILAGPQEESFATKITDFVSNKKYNVKNFYDYSGEHHLIHANLAFYNSGFAESLVFVIDRMGSDPINACRESESIFIASYPNNFVPIYKNFWVYDNAAHEYISILQKSYPSCDFDGRSMFGIVKTYESATSLIMQDVLENGKVMGLSAYGDKTKVFPELFTDKFIPNDYYLGHKTLGGNRVATNRELDKYATADITEDNYQLYADYSWNVQKQTQEAVAELINKYVQKTGIKNVCITGGYGLNVVANHYYITQFPDINFFFEPLADDSGNSIGAAMKGYRDLTLDSNIYKLEHTFFNGNKYNLNGIIGTNITTKDIAKLLSNGKSIAIFNGLAEAGPRSLGNRSILFDARDKNAKNKVNSIKKREWYRPFAAMVLENDADDFFEMGTIAKSEFMAISFPAKEKAIKEIPGVIHVDNTCRIQTVSDSNPIIFDLLNEFKSITGIGSILNTSFNLAGKPLVETPKDAFYTLKNSLLDFIWFPEIGLLVSKDDLQD